jgi:acetyltransferase-like isoleucine patch superfamily enzyme
MKRIIFILRNRFYNKSKISFSSYIKGIKNIVLGKKVKINHNVYLDCSNNGQILLNDNVTLNHFCQLQSRGGMISLGVNSEMNNFSLIYSGGSNIIIGKNVLIGPRVNIIGYSHGFSDKTIPIKEQKCISKDIIIEDDVWIGSQCTIMPGVTIGMGSVIGAGSIVTKDVLPYTINVGNPCRKIKNRD